MPQTTARASLFPICETAVSVKAALHELEPAVSRNGDEVAARVSDLKGHYAPTGTSNLDGRRGAAMKFTSAAGRSRSARPLAGMAPRVAPVSAGGISGGS